MNAVTNEVAQVPMVKKKPLSKDAIAQWALMLERAIAESHARQIVVPLRAYVASEDSSGEHGVFLAPLVVEIGALLERVITEHLEKQDLREGEDFALSKHVLVLYRSGKVELKQLDIWDAKPGLALHPGDKWVKHYAHLRTGNSYHLYPRLDVFLASGAGEAIADPLWSLGFLRVTESPAKGPIQRAAI